MATTIAKLIRTALRKVGAVPAGTNLTDAELADARDELRRMLDTWRLESLMVYAQTLRRFDLQPGKMVYTYGELGDFEAVRPQNVLAATILNEVGGSFPLIALTPGEYSALSYKDQVGRPTRFFYNPTFPMAELRFDRVPDDDAVELLVLEPLSVPDLVDTEFSFPPGYEDAVIYNLGMRLAGEYDVDPGQEVMGLAMAFKKLIKRSNLEVPKLLQDTASMGAYGTYDIMAGPVR